MSALSAVTRFCERVTFVFLAVLTAAILLQLLLRNVFDYGHPGIEEIARASHVSLVFLAIPQLFRNGKHIRIDLVVNALPPRVARVLEAFAALATAVFCGFFLYGDYLFMIRNGNVASPALEIPNYLFFAGAYIGIGLLLLTAAERFVILLAGSRSGGAA